MRKIIYFGFIIVFVSSCAPAYIPNLANIPLLEEEHELNICGAFSTSGTDVQLAYAVSDGIAIMANGTFLNVDNDEDYHKHLFGEIGFGKFWANENSFKAEIFCGFGIGNIRTDYDGTSAYMPDVIDASIKRAFIQPNIGFRTGFIDLGITSRFSFVNIEHEDNSLNTGKFETFWEPGIIGKIGYKVIKFYGEIGFSLPIYDHTAHYTNFPFYIGTGIQVNIKSLRIENKGTIFNYNRTFCGAKRFCTRAEILLFNT